MKWKKKYHGLIFVVGTFILALAIVFGILLFRIGL